MTVIRAFLDNAAFVVFLMTVARVCYLLYRTDWPLFNAAAKIKSEYRRLGHEWDLISDLPLRFRMLWDVEALYKPDDTPTLRSLKADFIAKALAARACRPRFFKTMLLGGALTTVTAILTEGLKEFVH